MHQRIKEFRISWVTDLLRDSRIGHLATCSKSLASVVPVCYVLREGTLYTPIDEKRKRRAPEDLRRIINIKANPNVSLVVDHYEEDWQQLRFIIIHGKAKIIRSGKEHAQAIMGLRRKYQQYHSMNLHGKPIIKISPIRIRVWKAGL